VPAGRQPVAVGIENLIWAAWCDVSEKSDLIILNARCRVTLCIPPYILCAGLTPGPAHLCDPTAELGVAAHPGGRGLKIDQTLLAKGTLDDLAGIDQALDGAFAAPNLFGELLAGQKPPQDERLNVVAHLTLPR
jgi:hypothetical protein